MSDEPPRPDYTDLQRDLDEGYAGDHIYPDLSDLIARARWLETERERLGRERHEVILALNTADKKWQAKVEAVSSDLDKVVGWGPSDAGRLVFEQLREVSAEKFQVERDRDRLEVRVDGIHEELASMTADRDDRKAEQGAANILLHKAAGALEAIHDVHGVTRAGVGLLKDIDAHTGGG